MKKEIKIAVAGACGRMGSTIISLLTKTPDMRTVWAFESKGHPSVGSVVSDIEIKDNLDECQNAEVLIDFTNPESSIQNLQTAKEKNLKVVIGTTGFSSSQIEIIRNISKEISVVVSPNMSIGVNIMMKLVETAAKMLGKDYEVEIIETHHHHKKDAPSGTALKIGEIINGVRGKKPQQDFVFGRSGIPGPRKTDEIGFHAVRISEVVGEHTVMFGGKGEILEISHRCFSRESFAQGALIAARFVVEKKAGFYQMSDVIDWLKNSV